MGTWHEHLDRRSKHGMAYHDANMSVYYAEVKLSEKRRKRAQHDAEAKARLLPMSNEPRPRGSGGDCP